MTGSVRRTKHYPGVRAARDLLGHRGPHFHTHRKTGYTSYGSSAGKVGSAEPSSSLSGGAVTPLTPSARGEQGGVVGSGATTPVLGAELSWIPARRPAGAMLLSSSTTTPAPALPAPPAILFNPKAAATTQSAVESQSCSLGQSLNSGHPRKSRLWTSERSLLRTSSVRRCCQSLLPPCLTAVPRSPRCSPSTIEGSRVTKSHGNSNSMGERGSHGFPPLSAVKRTTSQAVKPRCTVMVPTAHKPSAIVRSKYPISRDVHDEMRRASSDYPTSSPSTLSTSSTSSASSSSSSSASSFSELSTRASLLSENEQHVYELRTRDITCDVGGASYLSRNRRKLRDWGKAYLREADEIISASSNNNDTLFCPSAHYGGIESEDDGGEEAPTPRSIGRRCSSRTAASGPSPGDAPDARWPAVYNQKRRVASQDHGTSKEEEESCKNGPKSEWRWGWQWTRNDKKGGHSSKEGFKRSQSRNFDVLYYDCSTISRSDTGTISTIQPWLNMRAWKVRQATEADRGRRRGRRQVTMVSNDHGEVVDKVGREQDRAWRILSLDMRRGHRALFPQEPAPIPSHMLCSSSSL